MKTIANPGTLPEAQKLQAKLKLAGIDAIITDERNNGVRLQVAEKTVEKAIEVINEAYSISV